MWLDICDKLNKFCMYLFFFSAKKSLNIKLEGKAYPSPGAHEAPQFGGPPVGLDILNIVQNLFVTLDFFIFLF